MRQPWNIPRNDLQHVGCHILAMPEVVDLQEGGSVRYGDASGEKQHGGGTATSRFTRITDRLASAARDAEIGSALSLYGWDAV
ncbi:MAG TPA: hypothetical protein VE871_15170 [Longimicrobium sp.]|nr:hypothetical protein [Longimicrobium sp.]